MGSCWIIWENLSIIVFLCFSRESSTNILIGSLAPLSIQEILYEICPRIQASTISWWNKCFQIILGVGCGRFLDLATIHQRAWATSDGSNKRRGDCAWASLGPRATTLRWVVKKVTARPLCAMKSGLKCKEKVALCPKYHHKLLCSSISISFSSSNKWKLIKATQIHLICYFLFFPTNINIQRLLTLNLDHFTKHIIQPLSPLRKEEY